MAVIESMLSPSKRLAQIGGKGLGTTFPYFIKFLVYMYVTNVDNIHVLKIHINIGQKTHHT